MGPGGDGRRDRAPRADGSGSDDLLAGRRAGSRGPLLTRELLITVAADVGDVQDGAVPPTLTRVEAAVRRSWSAETTYASAEYLARAPERRSRGQCGTTALVINDLLGGELVVADLLADGVHLGVHYWNRLPDGSEVDLTGDQLLDDETLHHIRVAVRPEGPLPADRGRTAYLLLRGRVVRDLQATETAEPPRG